jgi:hypothetical protein
MALPASGPLSLLAIRGEFAPTAGSFALSAYLKGGSYVAAATASPSVPSSLPVKISDFYDATKTCSATRYPTAYAAASGTWGATPSNAYAGPDGSYAATSITNNGNARLFLYNYGWDSVIPAGSTIVSAVLNSYHTCWSGAAGTETHGAYSNAARTTLIAQASITSPSSALLWDSLTLPGATRDNLLDANFQPYYACQNSMILTTASFRLDVQSVTVTWDPPSL